MNMSMNKVTTSTLAALLLAPLLVLHAADAPQPVEPLPAFKAKLQATLVKHLNRLIGADGSVATLKGKTAEDSEALTFYLMQQFNPAYREEKLNAAVRKAQAFALKNIAPMTEPNHGPACQEHTTREAPTHYSLKEDTKRCFQLGRILFGGGYTDEGLKIMNAALEQFPVGNVGQDGAHAAEPSALILSAF